MTIIRDAAIRLGRGGVGQIATAAGVHEQTVYRWARGVTAVPVGRVVALLDAGIIEPEEAAALARAALGEDAAAVERLLLP